MCSFGRGRDLGELPGGRSSIEAPGGLSRRPLPRTGAPVGCPPLGRLPGSPSVRPVALVVVGARSAPRMWIGGATRVVTPPAVLAAQSKSLDERPVPLDVGLLQVVEQPPAAADQ